MFLVTGATGNVGGAVVRALAAAGHPVRAVSRRTIEPPELPEGAVSIAGDLNRPETLRGALEGVRAAFLMSGYENMAALLGDLGEAGAEHVALLSGSSAVASDTGNAVSRYMLASEQAARDSGLAWTILRPNTFMSNTLQWLPQIRSGDVVRAPFASVRVAAVDPADVAAVAAHAMAARDRDGETLRLSGPDATTPAERLQILAAALGRLIRFEAQPDDEARSEMVAAMSPEYVDAFFGFFVEGNLDESEVLPTVEQVLARPPRRFEQWAAAHAAAFR